MRNVEAYNHDGTLIIKVDLTAPGMLSVRGTNATIATSGGCREVPGQPEIVYTLSVFRRPKHGDSDRNGRDYDPDEHQAPGKRELVQDGTSADPAR